MKDTIRELTIGWLEEMQAHGGFDGIEEADKDFTQCDDEELNWYFTQWYFTEEKQEAMQEELGAEEFKKNYAEEIEEFNKIY